MKSHWTVLGVSLLAMPALAVAADRFGCDSVNFGEEVLAKFPNAKAACIDVKERNGSSTPTSSTASGASTPARMASG